jgi:3-dehydroquinate synthetase
MRAGYAEVVKYGLINDADFFAWCETHAAKILAREPHALVKAIEHSVRAKAKIVAADERETEDHRALLAPKADGAGDGHLNEIRRVGIVVHGVLGACVVVGSGLYLLWREVRH